MVDSRNSRAIAWVVLAAAISLGIGLRLAHHFDVGERSPDERMHTYFAARIANSGYAVMPSLYHDFEVRPELWYYPSPARIGHVSLFAAVMKITGWRDESAGALVSLLCSIVSLFVVAWIGARFFHPWVGVAATLFLAFSIGELGMARRAWRDLPYGLAALLLVYVTCEISRKPRRWIWYPFFFLLGAFMLLTKENGALGYGLCGLWLTILWLRRERSIGGATIVVGGGLLSALMCLGIWSIQAGGWSIARSALNHAVQGALTSTWAHQVADGPWYQFFYLLWLVGPLTAILALTGAVVVILRLTSALPAEDFPADYDSCAVVGMMAFAYIGFAAFAPNVQYLRTISPSNGSYCLLAGIGLCWLLTFAKRRLAEADFHILVLLAVLAVGNEGVRNYNVFTSVVVRTGMEDLAVGFIRPVLRR